MNTDKAIATLPFESLERLRFMQEHKEKFEGFPLNRLRVNTQTGEVFVHPAQFNQTIWWTKHLLFLEKNRKTLERREKTLDSMDFGATKVSKSAMPAERRAKRAARAERDRQVRNKMKGKKVTAN